MRMDETSAGANAAARRGLRADSRADLRSQRRSAVLLLGALVIVLGGCGQRHVAAPSTATQPTTPIADFRAVVTSVVTDPTRLKQMLVFADDAQRAVSAAQAQLEALSSEQDILARDYATSPEALADVSARLQATRVTYRTIIIHDRCEIAKLATDQEWNAIADHELGVLK